MEELIKRLERVIQTGAPDKDGMHPISAEVMLEVIKQLPHIQPEIVRCKDCKHWKDSDGVFRRGTGAESKCPLNLHQVYEGTFFCGLAERREVQDENDKTTNNTTNA